MNREFVIILHKWPDGTKRAPVVRSTNKPSLPPRGHPAHSEAVYINTPYNIRIPPERGFGKFPPSIIDRRKLPEAPFHDKAFRNNTFRIFYALIWLPAELPSPKPRRGEGSPGSPSSFRRFPYIRLQQPVISQPAMVLPGSLKHLDHRLHLRVRIVREIQRQRF